MGTKKKFLSTHPCGVRRLSIINTINLHNFYPRTPAGCDVKKISGTYVQPKFLSTHPCGVRPSCLIINQFNNIFLSTHPCGVRHFSRLYCNPFYPDFYPRTPAGCDQLVIIFFILRYLFLSTHPCGVRRFAHLGEQAVLNISIHAPLRGAT